MLFFFFGHFFALSAMHHAKLHASSCCILTAILWGLSPSSLPHSWGHRLSVVVSLSQDHQPVCAEPGVVPSWPDPQPVSCFPQSSVSSSPPEVLPALNGWLGGANTAVPQHTSSHTTIKSAMTARQAQLLRKTRLDFWMLPPYNYFFDFSPTAWALHFGPGCKHSETWVHESQALTDTKVLRPETLAVSLSSCIPYQKFPCPWAFAFALWLWDLAQTTASQSRLWPMLVTVHTLISPFISAFPASSTY